MKLYFVAFLLAVAATNKGVLASDYPIVDATLSSKAECWEYSWNANTAEQVFCDGTGQDGSYDGLQANYCNNEDGTITDLNTGLMWQNDTQALTYNDALTLVNGGGYIYAGHDDWRIPTIKELYTLIDFNGVTGTDESGNTPYINTDYFQVHYGTEIGQRFIDGQEWSLNSYTGSIMGQTQTNKCQFGVNFIDGRIKCYGKTATKWLRLVRNNPNTIGVNNFTQSGTSNDIIDDTSTGLSWMKYDSGYYNNIGYGDNNDGTMEWPDALHYCNTLNLDGYTDWRLPDAKELHSIVDYTKSPDYTGSPAIDDLFYSTPIESESSNNDYGWYWTSTTHFDGYPIGSAAVYIAFGRATGNYTPPAMGGDDIPRDVHGAGAQRSESKVGPLPTPDYRGPQNDFIRIWNYVRCVRGTSTKSTLAPNTCDTHTDSPTQSPVDAHPTKAPSSTKDTTPNFIVMQPDDLEFFESWVPPAHFAMSKIVNYPSNSNLPNMNWLRDRGVQFTRAYAASTMCGTSRYSTMTGRFPSRSSASRNTNSGSTTVSSVTIPTTKLKDVAKAKVDDGKDCETGNAAAAFQANGYATGVVGKWHLSGGAGASGYNYTEVQEEVRNCGFDYAEAIYKENLMGTWAANVSHNMEHVAARAIDFIEGSVNSSKPFFLYLNPTAPHSSGDVTDTLNHADCRDTVEGYLDEEPSIPGMTQDFADCKAYRQDVLSRAGDDDKQAGSVWVDDAVGSIIQTLQSLGQLDNTFFLFQQDHGTEGKGSLYEPGARIAQFVYYPDWIAPGSTFDGVVSTVDIVPTMFDFAGIQSGDAGYYEVDGKSWKDEVVNNNADWTDDRCVYLEMDTDRAVVCGCHKYIMLSNSSDATSSGTVSKGISEGYTFSSSNYYNLCEPGTQTYISAEHPVLDLEQDGTILAMNDAVAKELEDLIECYLGYTDPNKTPDYNTASCDNTISSTFMPTPSPTNGPTPTPNPTAQPTPNPTAQPTPNPTPNPTEQPTPNPTPQPTDACPACKKHNGDDGISMIFNDPLTGTCSESCFYATARTAKENNGWSCGTCPTTKCPSCNKANGTPGITMHIVGTGSCTESCFLESAQQNKENQGYTCGHCPGS